MTLESVTVYIIGPVSLENISFTFLLLFQVEVAVKQILAGLPVKNQGALANPQSLELFKNIPETKVW
jgi:hypothetical protein